MQKQYQHFKSLSTAEMKEVTGGKESVVKYKYHCVGVSASWDECIYDEVHPNNCPGAVCTYTGSCTVYTGYACD
ncbi:MAG: hypothetical protein QM687_10795 [Ferruginibacter sp.]